MVAWLSPTGLGYDHYLYSFCYRFKGCSNSDTAVVNPKPPTTPWEKYFFRICADTIHHDDAIELYNPTANTINLNNYYLIGTTNGSIFAPPFKIQINGTIAAHKTL